MPIYIFVRFHAKPGCVPKLVAALQEIVVPTRSETGCAAMNVFRSLDDPNSFFIHSHWKSQADLDSHIKSAHMQVFFTKIADLLTEEAVPSRTSRIA
jgi:quinol monooxygenase YgiN